jgi:hypothetical protein
MKTVYSAIAVFLVIDLIAVLCSLGAKLLAGAPIAWAFIGWLSMPWVCFLGGILLLLVANVLGEFIAKNEDFD